MAGLEDFPLPGRTLFAPTVWYVQMIDELHALHTPLSRNSYLLTPNSYLC